MDQITQLWHLGVTWYHQRKERGKEQELSLWVISTTEGLSTIPGKQVRTSNKQLCRLGYLEKNNPLHFTVQSNLP